MSQQHHASRFFYLGESRVQFTGNSQDRDHPESSGPRKIGKTTVHGNRENLRNSAEMKVREALIRGSIQQCHEL
jgi:hypothetical protein